MLAEWTGLDPQSHGQKRPGGGRAFTGGYLYRLLSNPVYIGGISHKGEVHLEPMTPGN